MSKDKEKKDLWIKDVQKEIKEEQKGKKPTKPVEKFEAKKIAKIIKAVKEVVSYTPPKDLFKQSGTTIAKQLLADSKTPGQAMKRLVYYINRGGSNLKADDMKRLNRAKEIIGKAVDEYQAKKNSKTAGFWTQKIISHKNMSKIKKLILDMKEDIMGEDYTESDEDKFIKDLAQTIDPLLN